MAVSQWLEAFQLSEFTQCFASSIPGLVPMSLAELQHTVSAPLEASSRLPLLYCAILKLLLASWVSIPCSTHIPQPLLNDSDHTRSSNHTRDSRVNQYAL